MILLIDNYDSFTYNLTQYIDNFAEVKVLRNDDAGLYQAAKKADALGLPPHAPVLAEHLRFPAAAQMSLRSPGEGSFLKIALFVPAAKGCRHRKIGRASCRERV